jgi:hypothetical protein
MSYSLFKKERNNGDKMNALTFFVYWCRKLPEIKRLLKGESHNCHESKINDANAIGLHVKGRVFCFLKVMAHHYR